MKMIQNKFSLIMIGALASALVCATIYAAWSTNGMSKIHILKAPLSIGSEKDNNYYLLPKGSYLYFDSVFPEGFTRYRLYVNVKEKLELRDNVERVEAPMSADSITKDRLINLLGNVKLDKDDVKAILGNGKFSESDKKEIADFIQTKNK